MKPRYPTKSRFRRRNNRRRQTSNQPVRGLRSPRLLALAVIGALVATYIHRDQPPAVVESAFQEPLTPIVEADDVGLLPEPEAQDEVTEASLAIELPTPTASHAEMTTFVPADVPVVLGNVNKDKELKKVQESGKQDVSLTFYKALARKKWKNTASADDDKVHQDGRLSAKRPSVGTGTGLFSAQGISPHPKGWSTSGSVIVQLAAYEAMRPAYALASNLRLEGAPVRIVQLDLQQEEQDEQKRLYRVQLGPFETRADAAKAAVFWRVEGKPALIM